MPAPDKTVGEYLKELKETKKEKPPQVKEALDIYVGLWEEAIKNGGVSREDEIGDALAKLEAKGGLYQAAQAEDVKA